MPGRVDQLDADGADVHDVAAAVAHQVGLAGAGHPLDPGGLVALDVDGHRVECEQLTHATDLVAHHVAADVVLVVVRDQRPGDLHAVGGGDVEDAPHVVSGVDDHGLAGLAVADQVDEVDHLPGQRVAAGDVAPREELAEVEPVGCVHIDPGTGRSQTTPRGGGRGSGRRAYRPASSVGLAGAPGQPGGWPDARRPGSAPAVRCREPRRRRCADHARPADGEPRAGPGRRAARPGPVLRRALPGDGRGRPAPATARGVRRLRARFPAGGRHPGRAARGRRRGAGDRARAVVGLVPAHPRRGPSRRAGSRPPACAWPSPATPTARWPNACAVIGVVQIGDGPGVPVEHITDSGVLGVAKPDPAMFLTTAAGPGLGTRTHLPRRRQRLLRRRWRRGGGHGRGARRSSPPVSRRPPSRRFARRLR